MDLEQWVSNFNVQMNHLGILLKYCFWFSESEVGLRFYIYKTQEMLVLLGNRPLFE